MNLDQFGKNDFRLNGLIRQARQWQKLNHEIKKILPANLRAYSQVVCIDKEGSLIILAANNMALGRLKMITPSLLAQMRDVDQRIIHVQVKPSPKAVKKEKENTLKLGDGALAALANSAERVSHHPELAAALHKIVQKYK